MNDPEYTTRNEPTPAQAVEPKVTPMNPTLPDEIIIVNAEEEDNMEAGYYPRYSPPTNFADLRNHLRKCERLLQLPATHLSGPDRYTVEAAMDAPDYQQLQWVETLYKTRQREAHLRGEEWADEGEVLKP